MRLPVWLGIVFVVLGAVFSFAVKSLIFAIDAGHSLSFSLVFGMVFLVLFASLFLGFGAALLIHSILRVAQPFTAFVCEIILCALLLLCGIAAGITASITSSWSFALQWFFTLFTAGLTLFVLSFTYFFSGLFIGIRHAIKTIKKTVIQATKK